MADLYKPVFGGVESGELVPPDTSAVPIPIISTTVNEGLRVILRPIRGLTKRHLIKEPFVFQAAPLEEFSRQSSYNHSEYDTLRGGQHSRPAGRALEQTGFGTIFVDYNAPWDLIPDIFDEEWRSVFPVPDPVAATKELRRIMNAGTPFLLSVDNPALRGGYDLRMAATFRSLTVTERAGEVDARYVDVSFVEYRDVRVKRFLKGEAGDDKLPITLLVRRLPKRHDTFSELAKHYYGDPSLWRHIRKANDAFAGIGGHQKLTDTKAYKKNHNVKVKVPRKPQTREDRATAQDTDLVDEEFALSDDEDITGVLD
jgi:hypothetical protein